jgi:hypothetical protein
MLLDVGVVAVRAARNAALKVGEELRHRENAECRMPNAKN